MKRNYDAVFFDFDGTIADTSKGIFASADYAARAFGLPIPDEAGHRYFIAMDVPRDGCSPARFRRR